MALSPTSVILVTGGTGLFGYAMRQAVEKVCGQATHIQPAGAGTTNGALITGEGMTPNPIFIWVSHKDADLRSYDSVKALFQRYNPTHVVHLAAKVGGLFANMSDNIGFFRENVEINDNVLKMCHEYKVQRAIFCLSTCVFPAEAKMPLTEDALHNGPPHPSNEGYSMAKRMLEMLVRFYRESYKYDWMCVIPTNLYGPNDNYNLEHSHVIAGLIHKCYLAQKSGQPFVVAGSGNPLRQFLYSYDAGEIMLKLLNSPDRFKEPTMILCGDADAECSIKDVSKAICTSMKCGKEPSFDTSKAEGIFRKTASNAKLRSFLGSGFKFTPLEKGVADSVEWFHQHYDKDLRK